MQLSENPLNKFSGNVNYLTPSDKIKTAFAIYLHMKDVQVEEVDENEFSIDTNGFYILLDDNYIWHFQVMFTHYTPYDEPDDHELETIFVHTSFDKCLIGGIKEYQDAAYGDAMASIVEDRYMKLLETEVA